MSDLELLHAALLACNRLRERIERTTDGYNYLVRQIQSLPGTGIKFDQAVALDTRTPEWREAIVRFANILDTLDAFFEDRELLDPLPELESSGTDPSSLIV